MIKIQVKEGYDKWCSKYCMEYTEPLGDYPYFYCSVCGREYYSMPDYVKEAVNKRFGIDNEHENWYKFTEDVCSAVWGTRLELDYHKFPVFIISRKPHPKRWKFLDKYFWGQGWTRVKGVRKSKNWLEKLLFGYWRQFPIFQLYGRTLTSKKHDPSPTGDE